ncbi:KAT8 regulatory NSL complex subunit 3 [Platysternon megacephalum]|uniref:KAT8 regulatory NSL complex subunit 3 n=1 Tax=Platysternon megacephalum TaxID=55544 RepID=A0A4D9DV97_9SAUR|nr:KAT8 regulatory NSL complex subunit 3 [Platysternon megacephalum]
MLCLLTPGLNLALKAEMTQAMWQLPSDSSLPWGTGSGRTSSYILTLRWRTGKSPGTVTPPGRLIPHSSQVWAGLHLVGKEKGGSPGAGESPGSHPTTLTQSVPGMVPAAHGL